MAALDHPAAASLDRQWDSTGSNLADHPALGQDLPAGLAVVAGIQVHARLGWQPNRLADRVERASISTSGSVNAARPLRGAGAWRAGCRVVATQDRTRR
jgi:hypothetical protein